MCFTTWAIQNGIDSKSTHKMLDTSKMINVINKRKIVRFFVVNNRCHGFSTMSCSLILTWRWYANSSSSVCFAIWNPSDHSCSVPTARMEKPSWKAECIWEWTRIQHSKALVALSFGYGTNCHYARTFTHWNLTAITCPSMSLSLSLSSCTHWSVV